MDNPAAMATPVLVEITAQAAIATQGIILAQAVKTLRRWHVAPLSTLPMAAEHVIQAPGAVASKPVMERVVFAQAAPLFRERHALKVVVRMA